MKRQILESIFFAIIAYLLIAITVYFSTQITNKDNCILLEIVENYHKNIRGYMFSGFLSIGTFMFSLMTFVITNLKEKLFDTQEYLEKLVSNEYLVHGEKLDITNIKAEIKYLPLRNQSDFISLSIASAIITSVMQFTIGFSDNILLIIISTFSGVVTLCFLAKSLYFMRKSLKIWLSTDITKTTK